MYLNTNGFLPFYSHFCIYSSYQLSCTYNGPIYIHFRFRWTASFSPPTPRWKFKIWTTKFTKRSKLLIQWRRKESSTWASQRILSFSLISGWRLNLEVNFNNWLGCSRSVSVFQFFDTIVLTKESNPSVLGMSVTGAFVVRLCVCITPFPPLFCRMWRDGDTILGPATV